MGGPGVVRSTAGRLNAAPASSLIDAEIRETRRRTPTVTAPSSTPVETETRETRRRVPTTKVTENKEVEQAEAHSKLAQVVEEALKPIAQQFLKEIGKLTATIKDQTKQYEALRNEFDTLKGEYADLRDSITDQVEGLKANIPSAISTQLLDTSYASVTCTTLINQSLPNQTATSISYRTTTCATEPLYCTIDTSSVEEDRKEETKVSAIQRTIEKEMRKAENQENWKCVAAMRDLRNTGCIRIACRNEEELQAVKKAAENAGTPGL
jgi:hypothetical protein